MKIVQIYFKNLNKLAFITNFLVFFLFLFENLSLLERKWMRIQSHRSAHTISLLCNPSPILPHVTSLTPHSSSLIPHLFSLLPHPSPLFPNLSIIPPSSPTPHLWFFTLPPPTPFPYDLIPSLSSLHFTSKKHYFDILTVHNKLLKNIFNKRHNHT